MAAETEVTMDISRAYQLEMLQSSLEGNTIVVMDTGSGKTHVAILRIMIELERGRESRLVWFLAPTVTLCIQQFKIISQNLPSASTRLITGSDNVERWSTQEIWDGILGSHRIIVSTHAILSDALSHGFITMSRLGLLVFDEAHHCIGEHPANKIMRDYYYPWLNKSGCDAVPHIMGLTASPVMKSNANEANLRLIERNLDALSKSPRIHHGELRRHVHLPRFIRIDYDARTPFEISPGLEDPPGKGRIRTELKRFCRKVVHIHSELGLWAVQRYIDLVSTKLKDQVKQPRDDMVGWQEDDWRYFEMALGHFPRCLSIQPELEHGSFDTSPKVEELIKFLVSQRSSQISGILFVEQRATVGMLQRLLSQHPDTSHLSYATFVGTSNPSKLRSGLSEIVDLNDQRDTLADFRTQKCNIVIATSVLEEGIDISSCNLVICFHPPANLKSFIQRRGRAREIESIFVLMLARGEVSARIKNWEALEAEMKKVYQDQQRDVEHAMLVEESGEEGRRRFEIQSTGALLSLESAIPHLNHFCTTLPKFQFVDYRPLYIFHSDSNSVSLKAEVILPNCLDPTVRRAFGTQYWQSERQAKKDAAFEAYVALYHAGLVNDHLLPEPRLHHASDISPKRVSPRLISSVELDPWAHLANIWQKYPNLTLNPTVITIERPSESPIRMVLLIPEQLPSIPPCELCKTRTQTYAAHFENVTAMSRDANIDFVDSIREVTHTILQPVHSSRMARDRNDFVTIFVPSLDPAKLAEWKMANVGRESASVARQRLYPPAHVVRNPILWNVPQSFTRWLDDDEALEVISLPRKRNFLECGQKSSVHGGKRCKIQRAAKVDFLPIKDTEFDRLSPNDVDFSLLIPSLMRHIAKYFLAGQLATTVLSRVEFDDLAGVVEALSAPSACETSNYQRLEHIGDTVLKLIVVSQVFVAHHNWHEGYLSQAKDRLVANDRLTLAAVQNHIDRYITSTPFSPRKWTPPYIQELSKPESLRQRSFSKKVLADIVEALIGAAYIDGGLRKAARCVHVFLPEVNPDAIGEMFQKSNSREQTTAYQQHNFADLQRLVNFQFRNVGRLVEAMTHPSFTNDLSTPSYQRLEFLGDAVLDMLIVQRLASHTTPPLSHDRMHLIRSALTNASFQAFLCMEFSFEREIIDVIQEDPKKDLANNAIAVGARLSKRVALCDFIRHQSLQITQARQACLQTYSEMATSIRHAIEHGTAYPWALLTRLEAPKYLADVVESVFAAVFVDSEGDMQICEQLANRTGLMAYLGRILRDDIELRHPKTVLGELAASRGKVKYSIKGTLPAGFQCTVTVGSIKFDEVVGGSSRDEVTVRAADAAIVALGQLDSKEQALFLESS